MKSIDRSEFCKRMNEYGRSRRPCLFIADFEGREFVVAGLDELEHMGISAEFEGRRYGADPQIADCTERGNIVMHPISYEQYKIGFDEVMERLKYGDTYLLNLTYPTLLEGVEGPELLYTRAYAPYKMLFGGRFLFYSPEPFVRIEDDTIHSFPMKGTIDATLDGAEELLLGNKKELYEHYTIVDLIRNDLATVAEGINVDSFRYIEPVKRHSGVILQTSSKISGRLAPNWRERLGENLLRLLPAGSISGAPKERSVEIIRKVEICERGFYTGVAGVFDGETLSSCVMIRFMEILGNGRYIYHSGGGITAMSSADEEYAELISKIYVPVI